MPSMHNVCHSHGLMPIPEQLADLSDLEERLVSMRIPFMHIEKLRIQQQSGLKGSVVNVPTNLNKISTVLPRTDIDEHTVIVNLKRKLSFDHAWLRSYIKPARVQSALQFLLQQPFYQQHAASLSTDALQLLSATEDTEALTDNDMEAQAVVHTLFRNILQAVCLRNNTTLEDEDCDAGSEGSCHEETVTDTSIDPDVSATLLHDKVINIAPGEGDRPVGILLDEHAEEMSFPKLYCGSSMGLDGNPQSYAMLCRWQLRHVDIRFRNSVRNIFFKYKKLQAKRS